LLLSPTLDYSLKPITSLDNNNAKAGVDSNIGGEDGDDNEVAVETICDQVTKPLKVKKRKEIKVVPTFTSLNQVNKQPGFDDTQVVMRPFMIQLLLLDRLVYLLNELNLFLIC